MIEFCLGVQDILTSEKKGRDFFLAPASLNILQQIPSSATDNCYN